MSDDKDIQDLNPDERLLKVLLSVDDMLSKFEEQEHIQAAIKSGSISPKIVDLRLTEHLISSLRWVTANLDLDQVDKFIDKNDFEHPEVIKGLLRENTFNVRMYN